MVVGGRNWWRVVVVVIVECNKRFPMIVHGEPGFNEVRCQT